MHAKIILKMQVRWQLLAIMLGFYTELSHAALPTVCKNDGMFSTWSEWTPCSRTCGTGVSSRQAHCLNGRCSEGSKVEYKSCCPQRCESENARVEFREEQCKDRTSSLPGHWTLFDNVTMDCSLRCLSERRTVLVSSVLDGTPCSTHTSVTGVCLGTLCASVGCDGVLGSRKVMDKCLRCVDISDPLIPPCAYIQATLHPSPTRGDVHLAVLPAGAVSITITRTALSNTGTLSIIGASAMRDVFSRSESSGVEMLTATGPLSQPVTIILKDVLEGAPNVSYQYHYTELSNIPYTSNTTLPVPDTVAQFGWTTGCYGPCSTSCGGGMSIAHPKCIDKVFPDRTLPDQFCDSATKPSPRVRKCNTESCPPRWVSGEWSVCLCGGKELRQVTCQQPTNEKPSSVVEDSACTGQIRPASVRDCFSNCLANWTLGPWTKCREDCGGNRYRTVQCVDGRSGRPVHSMYCPDLRPVSQELCPCSQYCTWTLQKWKRCSNTCGLGQQLGVVRCKNTTSDRKVDESCCQGQTKPEDPVRPCYSNRRGNCHLHWEINNIGKCEGVCCGQQKRKVMHRCVSEYNEAVFPDEWCKDIRKPNTVLNCSTSDCARWSVGEWSECLCGGQGFRNRSVTCVRGVTRVDRDVCEECSNPISEVQVCTGSPCVCVDNHPETCVDVPRPCGTIHMEQCCATCNK